MIINSLSGVCKRDNSVKNYRHGSQLIAPEGFARPISTNKKGAHTCSMGIPASHLGLILKVQIFRRKTQSECFNIFEVSAKII